MTAWDRGVRRGVLGLTPRPEFGVRRLVAAFSGKLEAQIVKSADKSAHSKLARVPGIGLLNRTCKRRVERHEVQFLRGLPLRPKIISGCVAQTAERASHKREVGGSTPPTATKIIFRFTIAD